MTTLQTAVFKDHADAASRLADTLRSYSYSAGIVLAGSCRGTLEGLIIAHTLGLPLDILLHGPIAHPADSTRAIGVVTLYGVLLKESDVSVEDILGSVQSIKKSLYRQYAAYTGRRQPMDIRGRYVIVTDSCIRADSTLPLVLSILRSQAPKKIIVAVPVVVSAVLPELGHQADELSVLLEADDCDESRFYEYPGYIGKEQSKHILHECSRKNLL